MGFWVDLYSYPYNAFSGQLTQLQKDALVTAEQSQIESVASSPGAQIDATVQAISQQAADANAANAPSDVSATSALASQCNHPLSLGGFSTSICLDGVYNYKWYIIGIGALITLAILAPYIKLFSKVRE